jgi:hypothetical protein
VVDLITGIQKNLGAAMFGVLVKTIVCAGSAVCLLFAPAVSQACSYPKNSPHQIDPNEIGLDQEPPSKVLVGGVYFERPNSGDDYCWGMMAVTLIIIPATDERTDAEHMGYTVSRVGDYWPEGFGFTDNGDPGPVLAFDADELFLYWSDMNDDGSQPIDFSFAISAVDLAGNQGPASEPVHIFDPGSQGGCATNGFGDPSSASLWLFLFVLGLRKTGCRRKRGTLLR